MSFGELLSKYYTYIFIMVILIYTIVLNRRMYSAVNKRFILLLVLVVLETIMSTVETRFA